ncbi:hypothetical protein D3C81_1689440 [compost metagenome]
MAFELDFVGHRLEFAFAHGVRMPVGKNMIVEIVAMVTYAMFVKDDLGIGGIHHAIAANLVLSHSCCSLGMICGYIVGLPVQDRELKNFHMFPIGFM